MSCHSHRAPPTVLLLSLALSLVASLPGCPESTTPPPGDGGGMTADAPSLTDVGVRVDTGVRLDSSPGTDALVVGDGAEPIDVLLGTDGGGPADAPLATDGGVATDAPAATDGGTATDAPVVMTDAAGTDAGPMCGGFTTGACGAGTTCECCPAGGPLDRCVCTTTCTTDGDCTDVARPVCEIPPGSTSGFCRASTFNCCWLCG